MEEIVELLSFVPILLLIGIVVGRKKRNANKKAQSEMREAFDEVRQAVNEVRNMPRRKAVLNGISADDFMKSAFQPKAASEESQEEDDEEYDEEGEGGTIDGMIPEEMIPEDMTVKGSIPEGEDFHAADFHTTEQSEVKPTDAPKPQKGMPGMLAKGAVAAAYTDGEQARSAYDLRTEDMKRAIILSEILDKPVSLRRGRR